MQAGWPCSQQPKGTATELLVLTAGSSWPTGQLELREHRGSTGDECVPVVGAAGGTRSHVELDGMPSPPRGLLAGAVG